MAKTQVKFKIKSIGVEGNRPDWTIKLKGVDGVDEAKKFYTVSIEVDQDYFARRIESCNKNIIEAEKRPDMFDNSEVAIKEYKNQIKNIEREQKKAEEMEIENFGSAVSTVDFEKGILTLSVVEEVALGIIKIRNNFEAYIVNLS